MCIRDSPDTSHGLACITSRIETSFVKVLHLWVRVECDVTKVVRCAPAEIDGMRSCASHKQVRFKRYCDYHKETKCSNNNVVYEKSLRKIMQKWSDRWESPCAFVAAIA
eukprot:TRINITY_DN28808_c0_g1_i1.p1 TRINITY_DN28808_c0_g1~~TRINITY_DN28808_c0_g1_i1.p1  ORF type:complete len:109 (-),score=18.09 TRINITY_DN28808_c0_g1_i1:36-362(-)